MSLVITNRKKESSFIDLVTSEEVSLRKFMLFALRSNSVFEREGYIKFNRMLGASLSCFSKRYGFLDTSSKF